MENVATEEFISRTEALGPTPERLRRTGRRIRWTGKRRPEVDLCPAQMKIRFEREEEET